MERENFRRTRESAPGQSRPKLTQGTTHSTSNMLLVRLPLWPAS